MISVTCFIKDHGNIYQQIFSEGTLFDIKYDTLQDGGIVACQKWEKSNKTKFNWWKVVWFAGIVSIK